MADSGVPPSRDCPSATSDDAADPALGRAFVDADELFLVNSPLFGR